MQRALIVIMLCAGIIGPSAAHAFPGAAQGKGSDQTTRKAADPAPESSVESIPDLFDRVSPAVVFVTATSISPYQLFDRVTKVGGSGVIIDPSGLILTNSHVVYGRRSIQVMIGDGSILPAKLVGADPIFDLALIRIPPPTEGALPVAVLGNSDRTRVGDEALAIGNPMGLGQTMTRGIISAINRVLPETFYSLQEPMIQTDAPINPGNSGGPLLNRQGEVIGITTSILPEAQNIGFAIPANLIKAVLPSLMKEGRIIRPWIGFHGQLINGGLKELFRAPLVEGLLVEVVEPGSPAEQAGLQGGDLEVTIAGQDFLFGGDIITHLNGIALTSEDGLAQALEELEVGTTLHLTAFRYGKKMEIAYRLPERPVLPGDLPGRNTFAPAETGKPLRSGRRPARPGPPLFPRLNDPH